MYNKNDINLFQAAGKPISEIIASLIRDIVLFIPLIIILPAFFGGVESILYAAPVADILAIIVTIILTVLFFKKINKLEKDETIKA